MVHIRNGKVFIKIEDKFKETTNPELIGLAILDLAETNKKERKRIDFVTRDHKKLIGIIDAEVEIQLLHNYLQDNMNNLGFCIEHCDIPFEVKIPSTQYLVKLIEMIKSGKLVLREQIELIKS